MTEVTITGAMVLADRKARKLSMSAYAELVGLTPAKINNIEKKRDPKPDELEKLRQFITAAPGGEAPGADAVEPPPGAVTAEPVEGAPAPDGDVVMLDEEDLEAELEGLIGPQFTDGTDEFVAPVITDGDYTLPDPQAQAYVELLPLMPDGTRHVSHGEYATFKRCKRKWYLGYYRQLGLPREPRIGAAPLGTRLHKALQAYYVPGGMDPAAAKAALELTIAEDQQALANDPVALAELAKEADLARAMLEGYFQWLAETGADEGLTIVGSEQRLVVESGVPGVKFIGKLDVRALRDQDQARLVLDHKSVGDFVRPTKWLHMREQPLHYLLLEYLDLNAQGMAHERSTGALWNMLRKVKRTGNAKPPFYDRAEVRASVKQLESYWRHIMSGVRAIEQVRAALNAGWDHQDVADPTPTNDCSWDCDFFHVCSMFDDGSHIEDFISVNMVTINPLKRYEPEGVAD